MHRPLGIALHENRSAFQYLRFYNRQQLCTIVNHLLTELEAVVAHFEGDQNTACDLEAVLVDEVWMKLDHCKDLAEAQNR